MAPLRGPDRRLARAAVRGAVVCALALGVLSACGVAEASPRFRDAQPSRERLVRTVLDALAAHDTAALRSLMITREEYRNHMWEALPRSPNEPFDFIWGLTVLNRRRGLLGSLGKYGGIELAPVSLEFTKEAERYDGFTLDRGAELRVRRVSDGKEGVLPMLDVLVETPDGWKVLDYDD